MHRNICKICISYMISHPTLPGWLSCSCGYAHKENPNMSDEIVYIKRDEVLMGRQLEYPLTPELEANLETLLKALNKLRKAYGKPMVVSSGYRPGKYNVAAGGAKKSNHMTCQACDFKDANGDLDKWCMANLNVLEECGLYLEHPDATKGWCHLQTTAPKSGNRVFKP